MRRRQSVELRPAAIIAARLVVSFQPPPPLIIADQLNVGARCQCVHISMFILLLNAERTYLARGRSPTVGLTTPAQASLLDDLGPEFPKVHQPIFMLRLPGLDRVRRRPIVREQPCDQRRYLLQLAARLSRARHRPLGGHLRKW